MKNQYGKQYTKIIDDSKKLFSDIEMVMIKLNDIYIYIILLASYI